MNAITLANVALHALLLSAIGWGLVRWCVPDARHRAWTSLLALLVALIAPILMEFPLSSHGFAASVAEEQVPTPAAASWIPDWKISTATLAISPVSAVPTLPSPATSGWLVAHLARWTCIFSAAGGLLIALHHCVISLWAWRLRRRLRPLTNTEARLVPSTPWRRVLRVIENAGCPCVVGLWRPVIAVPRGIFGAWNTRQWMWLLRHEGEHIRGRDTMIVWLLGWAKALLWWNPFAHALVEQWSQAREEICDGAAVAGETSAADYSTFLLDIAAGNRTHAPTLLHMAASQPARRMRARLSAMLAKHGVRKRVSAWFMTGVTVVLASLVAVVSCVGLKAEDIPPSRGVPPTRTQTAELIDPNTPTADDAHLRTFAVAGAGTFSDLWLGGANNLRGFEMRNGSLHYYTASEVKGGQEKIGDGEKVDVGQAGAGKQPPKSQAASLIWEVPFVTAPKQFAKGDDIVIDKVMCSSIEFKAGDRVVVQGHYQLASIPDARLALSLTTTANGGRGKWQREQYGDVKRGSGTFERAETIQYDGSLHLSFYDMTTGISIGGVYFGTQQQVDRIANRDPAMSRLVISRRVVEQTHQNKASSLENAPPLQSPNAASLLSEVRFVSGLKHFAAGDDIVIDKIMCTSREFKAGDKVVVQGHYQLTSSPEARLALSLTTSANGGRGRWQPEQYGDVKRGSGTFERTVTIQHDGSLHLSFYDMTALRSIGEVYFGTQQQVDRITR